MNYLPQNKTCLFLLVLLFHGNAFAQVQEVNFVELYEKPEFTINPNEEKQLSLYFLIKEGFHIQANRVKEDNFIPTVLSFEEPEGLIIGNPVFPQAEEFKMEGVDESMYVFGGVLEIKIPVKAGSSVEKRTIPVQTKLRYQACNASKCFYPRDLDFNLKLTIP